MNTPELTTLRARGFRKKLPSIEGDPTHEDLAQATLVVAAATTVFTIEPRAGNPPLELSELGQAQAFAVEIANKIQAREAAPDPHPGALEAMLAEMRTMLTTTATNLDARLTGIENTIIATRGEFQDFKTTFGRWSRPLAQRFSRECLPGIGFQAVPYPDSEFPDAATMEHLSTRSSVLNLDMTTLSKICKRYGIRYPRLRAERDEGKMKRQLLNHLCGLPDEDAPVNEEEPEGEDEEIENGD